MHERSALGPADIDDARLAALVAAALGVADVELLSSRADVVAYDIEAITTAGRYRVTGQARHCGGQPSFAFFVKVVQSWGRSPAFRFVPEEMREYALASVPFEAEPRVYRSDLADRLPPGLTMPRAYAVIDLDARVHGALARGRLGDDRTLGSRRARPGCAPARPPRCEPAGPAAGDGGRPGTAPLGAAARFVLDLVAATGRHDAP